MVGDLYYYFLEIEVNSIAIIVINIKSTNNLLTNRFMFNKLYKI